MPLYIQSIFVFHKYGILNNKRYNKKRDRTGSLFQQNSKIKPLNDIFHGKISKPSNIGHDYYCFHYIHNNPVDANLVIKNEDWEFSSYRDYLGLRNGSLINKTLALKIKMFMVVGLFIR